MHWVHQSNSGNVLLKHNSLTPPCWYLHRVQPGDTAISLAREMLDNRPHFLRSAQEAEAAFRQNNYSCLNRNGPLACGDVVNLSPFPLSQGLLREWELERQPIIRAYPEQRDLFAFIESTPYNEGRQMTAFEEKARSSGWSVSKEGVIRFAGYGISGADGYAAAADTYLSGIQKLSTELLDEAVKKHGKDVLQKKSLKTLEGFLKSHPKYKAMQEILKGLPSSISSSLGDAFPSPHVNCPNARLFRGGFAVPAMHGNAARYCDSVSNRLAGKIATFVRVGVATTWALPSAIGVYNVYDAPQEKKLRVRHTCSSLLYGRTAVQSPS